MSYQTPRWPAGIGAIVCTGFVLFALFRDVRTLSDIGASQGGIIVSMTVAMLSGYYFTSAHAFFERVLFGILFAVATFISVGLGGGRTNAMLEEKVDQAQHATASANDYKAQLGELRNDRDDARKALPTLEQALVQAQKLYTERCKVGPKSCEAAKPGLDTAQETLTKAQDRRDTLEKSYNQLSIKVIDTKPTPKANAELNSMTRLLALAVGDAQAHDLIRLVWPFLLATIGELGFIAFTHKLMERRPASDHITISPVEIKPRRADPHAVITISQLASQLDITPTHMRRFLRTQLKMDPPEGGWKFTVPEAHQIAQRFALYSARKTSPTLDS